VRLFAEFPKESAALAARLGATRQARPRVAIEEASLLLEDLASMREGAKKSHNTAIAGGIRDFIAERFADPDLGLAMVAEKFRFSENYLSNLYKEQTGECISETIEAARVAAAKDALSSTDASLDEVAASTGYRSVASFRRAFKRVVGVSPSDYRSSDCRD
jgi:AraC-like DNA-binding protein